MYPNNSDRIQNVHWQIYSFCRHYLIITHSRLLKLLVQVRHYVNIKVQSAFKGNHQFKNYFPVCFMTGLD